MFSKEAATACAYPEGGRQGFQPPHPENNAITVRDHRPTRETWHFSGGLIVGL